MEKSLKHNQQNSAKNLDQKAVNKYRPGLVHLRFKSLSEEKQRLFLEKQEEQKRKKFQSVNSKK
jgi:hypothetical protein